MLLLGERLVENCRHLHPLHPLRGIKSGKSPPPPPLSEKRSDIKFYLRATPDECYVKHKLELKLVFSKRILRFPIYSTTL